MKPVLIAWTQPQHCGDCSMTVPEGWQELKYSSGGPYLEKRCCSCAEVHYGNALSNLADDLPKKVRRSGQNKKTDKPMTEAPLLGLAGSVDYVIKNVRNVSES